MSASKVPLAPVLAILGGASCIALAPIMVKLSELGPQATAFWRLALSLPALALWAGFERRARPGRTHEAEGDADAARRPWGLLVLAGCLFAGDLVTWHAGIVRTSAANATFLANLTPVVVVAVSWIWLKTRPADGFLAAVGLALVGSLLMSGGAPGHDPRALTGDLLSAATSLWYAAYLLTVARARDRFGPGAIMLVSTAVAAPLTLAAALAAGEAIAPDTTVAALGPLLVLGLVSHAGGQGLLAYGLGQAPTPLASVLILIQPVLAGVLGWWLLSETLGPLQIAGGALVLIAVFLARRAS